MTAGAIWMPQRKKRQDAITKVDKELLRKARHIANHRDVPLSEYLSEALRPVIDKDFAKFRKEIGEDDPPKPRSRPD